MDVIVNFMYLGCGLLVKQNVQLAQVTLASAKL